MQNTQMLHKVCPQVSYDGPSSSRDVSTHLCKLKLDKISDEKTE